MSNHYSSFLEITFFNEEDTNKFYMSLNPETQTTISFKTNDFSIDTSNGYIEEFDTESVLIVGESHTRDIGGENVRDFFNEIEEMGKNLGIEIKNIYLRFLSYDDDEEGYTIFVRNLEKDALDKFYRMQLADEFGEDFEETDDEEMQEEISDFENNLIDTYSKVPWVICCGINELEEVINSDEEGRETPLDFEEEVGKWNKDIINKWQFPWDEGCTMWIAALDEDGEYLWDNQ